MQSRSERAAAAAAAALLLRIQAHLWTCESQNKFASVKSLLLLDNMFDVLVCVSSFHSPAAVDTSHSFAAMAKTYTTTSALVNTLLPARAKGWKAQDTSQVLEGVWKECRYYEWLGGRWERKDGGANSRMVLCKKEPFEHVFSIYKNGYLKQDHVIYADDKGFSWRLGFHIKSNFVAKRSIYQGHMGVKGNRLVFLQEEHKCWLWEKVEEAPSLRRAGSEKSPGCRQPEPLACPFGPPPGLAPPELIVATLSGLTLGAPPGLAINKSSQAPPSVNRWIDREFSLVHLFPATENEDVHKEENGKQLLDLDLQDTEEPKEEADVIYQAEAEGYLTLRRFDEVEILRGKSYPGDKENVFCFYVWASCGSKKGWVPASLDLENQPLERERAAALDYQAEDTGFLSVKQGEKVKMLTGEAHPGEKTDLYAAYIYVSNELGSKGWIPLQATRNPLRFGWL